MMRPVSTLVVGIFLALASAETARAEFVTLGTDTQPNVVSLWSTSPFVLPPSSAFPNGWGVGFFDPLNPNFIQLQRPAGFGLLNPTVAQGNAWLTYTQEFVGPVSTNPAFRMDYQEVYWNTATNSFVQGLAGRLQSDGANFQFGTYGATPGLGPTTSGGAPLFIGPVPEPSTMIAFGLGLGVVALSRRRRAKQRI